ncbi:MAG: hypothetical protein KKH12_07540 [Gammaproteobacteria bacterium]|nr:hypothetical protein [Gammaproteobacteria bacterium]MBU1481513.1 hypothetical protein [Gammaproteobacteria bacterium]
MTEKLKQLSTTALGIVFFLALLCMPFLFIRGSAWAAEHLLQPLFVIGWVLLALDLLVLLPLSLFRRLRGFTGTVIFLSSFVFGLVTWLLGFILTYALWGLWAVIIGVLFFGGAVVPFALLATMFKGMWVPFFTVLILFVITFASRIAGAWIAEKQ